jgi:hypothetical protein
MLPLHDRLSSHLPNVGHLLQNFLNRGAQVLHQVAAVGDLNRIRRTLPSACGKRAGTVTSNDLHTWMRLQPGRQSCATGVRKQLKQSVCAEIDQAGFEV